MRYCMLLKGRNQRVWCLLSGFYTSGDIRAIPPLTRYLLFAQAQLPCLHKRDISTPLRFVSISVRRPIDIKKEPISSKLESVLFYIYRACAKRLHSHLFCNFFCEVFFFLFNTFACFKTNEFLDA